jgi:hypothetical protein
LFLENANQHKRKNEEKNFVDSENQKISEFRNSTQKMKKPQDLAKTCYFEQKHREDCKNMRF